jgi:osmotically-inducible protein OsmY
MEGVASMDKSMDEKIELEIRNILDKEMQESGIDKRIQSKDGYVTLSGFADTLAEKNAAGELAKGVAGVKSVENCLTISTDGTITDKEIEAEVINKLKGHSNLTTVSPKVERGQVVLEGKVETLRDKINSMQMTSKALGVRDVISHLEIGSADRVDDVTIKNRLNDGFIEADLDKCHIRVDVINGNLKLSGYVDSTDNIEAAVEIAEGLEGVKTVKSFLTLRRTD